MEPSSPLPSRQPSACDPLAAAVGNASLLGVGYLLLRRPVLAAVNGVVVLTLLVMAVVVDRQVWVQIAVLPFWVAVTAHGWLLATRRDRPGSVRRPRLIAVVAMVAVVATLAGLRADASRIEREATEPHRAGRCEDALSILGELQYGHRLVDASLFDRAPESEEACRLVVEAEDKARQHDLLAAAATLRTYQQHPAALWTGARDRWADLLLRKATAYLEDGSHGGTLFLQGGFDQLSAVLDESPGRQREVASVLDGFLANLDEQTAQNPCEVVAVTDWLGDRPSSGDLLDRATSAVSRIAPEAIVACGHDYLSDSDPVHARARFRQLLDQYPGHKLAGEAKLGDRRAGLAIQFQNVRALLGGLGGKDYCERPAAWAGARPYRGRGHGPYPALMFGQPGHEDQLPVSWRAKGAADAVLVLCADIEEFGSVVETCRYSIILGADSFEVRFRKHKVPVRVYELRTGRLVTKTALQIGGKSCPESFTHEYLLPYESGVPDPDRYVTSSKGDIRAAYKTLIDP